VITNIEEDHLDFYKDLDDIKSTFMELADKVPEDGKIICNFNDPNLQEIIEKHSAKAVDFSVYINQLPQLKVIGEHNKLNAAAALAISGVVGADLSKAKTGLTEFSGTWRRMESRGQNKNGALIFDDYAHHPTAVKFALQSLQDEFPEKNIVVMFQPHLHSRTRDFFNEFIESLKIANEIFLYPIYEARKDVADAHDVSSEKLAEQIPGAKMLYDFNEVKKEIDGRDENDVVVVMGAGDLFEVLG
jgi:UDP-N-acetylmuramate--alanine ligase